MDHWYESRRSVIHMLIRAVEVRTVVLIDTIRYCCPCAPVECTLNAGTPSLFHPRLVKSYIEWRSNIDANFANYFSLHRVGFKLYYPPRVCLSPSTLWADCWQEGGGDLGAWAPNRSSSNQSSAVECGRDALLACRSAIFLANEGRPERARESEQEREREKGAPDVTKSHWCS